MKLNTIYKSIITEDIYGRNAIVYHRTNVSDLINRVFDSEFKIGPRNMYGPGFYATYDLESQDLPNMKKNYGNIVVKFQVTIDNFLILDYDEFIKSPLGRKLHYDKTNFIYKQLDYFKIEYNKHDLDIIVQRKLSENIAGYIRDNVDYFFKRIEGMIYTSSEVGKSIVCYKPKLIIPISYREDDSSEFIKVDKNLNYLKKVFNNRSKEFNELSGYGIKELRDGLTISELQNDYPWLLKANIEDAVIGINEYKFLIWYDGKWNGGTWEEGHWYGGTFSGGYWYSGHWHNGKWENGEIFNWKLLDYKQSKKPPKKT